VGFDPEEAFTEHDETCNVEDSVGIQIMKLNPIGKEKTSEERMRGKRKPLKEKCKKDYLETRRWTGNDLWTGGDDFRRIILQNADLLGARQLPVSDLGLDPIPNSGRVSIDGLGLLHGGTTGGAGCGRASLAHDSGARRELRGNGRMERCVAGEVRKEEDDGGGVGVNSYSSGAIFISPWEIAGPS
jgi:hypothetical protein